ncbi:magnesium transporter [Parelusimicrobium proximum]|uniref:magnesium transporter CorA family protein n=1 Tax=Parelusimicrobium proximum TaxID=3228953 RepID=UPI003D178738
MSKRYNIENGKIVEAENGEGQVLLFNNPTIEEQRYLIETLNIDEHTLASAMDPEEQARLEFEPNHVALIFKRPKNYSGKDQLEFKVASMGMFLYPDKLVIVMADEISLFIGKRFASVADVRDLFLKLIYNAITHYMEHLRVINMISEEIEDKMTESMDNKYLLNLLSLEKSLVYYVNAISANGFVFEKIKNFASKLDFDDVHKETMDDILIENNQCQKQAEIDSNILALLIGARANIISNNLSILIKKLTAITIWLMVPALVIGIFSINTPIPLQESPAGFWVVIVLSVLSVWLAMLWWKMMKW